MTREYLEQIVNVWQKRLNLLQWRITLEWSDEPLPDAFASVRRVGEYYDEAANLVSSNHDEWDAQLATEIIVHELMHIMMFDLQAGVLSAGTIMPAAAFKLFSEWHRHELEGVVDRVALMFVQLAGIIEPASEEEEECLQAS